MDRSKVGIVIIGRNEGNRLKQCVRSAKSVSEAVVYVDSGSTDGSVEWVNSEQVEAIELDMNIPFTAGRARNEGFAKLTDKFPDLKYVHFIDGDCYLEDGWVQKAVDFLESHPLDAVVCGRRKEIQPQASVYNYLCDLEWDGPKGSIKESGGDFLIRSEVMSDVGGFSPEIIAGEEPDLCFRIRQKGWRIHRLPSIMTHHDADIHAFSQWWKRNVRSGHAYANIAHLHLDSEEKIYQKETLSNLVWGCGIPITFVLMSALWPPAFVVGVTLYAYLFYKCVKYAKSDMKLPLRESAAYSFFIVLGKFPHMFGVFHYVFRRIFRRKYTLIEYK